MVDHIIQVQESALKKSPRSSDIEKSLRAKEWKLLKKEAEREGGEIYKVARGWG